MRCSCMKSHMLPLKQEIQHVQIMVKEYELRSDKYNK